MLIALSSLIRIINMRVNRLKAFKYVYKLRNKVLAAVAGYIGSGITLDNLFNFPVGIELIELRKTSMSYVI